MIEAFLNMPQWLQIFLVVAMFIGLAVMWRFRAIVAAVGVGAVAIFLSLKNKSKNNNN